MTGPRRPDDTDWQRRRRLAEVFGDVLPDTTSDERDDPATDPARSGSDAWLRDQVPPHHGGS
jgi:hypothetical protein